MDNRNNPTSTKLTARIFIDYEYWYYACKNMDPLAISPDISEFRRILEDRFQIDEILVFGDFQGEMGSELTRIRELTNCIFETHQENYFRQKDITDFVMLDHIYQNAFSSNCEAFVLFTGDGHFQNAVNFLRQKASKKVIVYGFEESFAAGLKKSADEIILLPKSDSIKFRYEKLIINNMLYVASHPEINPTFTSTVNVIKSRNEEISEENLRDTLSSMLNNGLLYRAEKQVAPDVNIQIILPDWRKLAESGICSDLLLTNDQLQNNYEGEKGYGND